MTFADISEKSVGLRAARQIVEAQGAGWKSIFTSLRQKKELSTAIREMNALVDHPVHGDMVQEAFERMGLHRIG